MPNALKLWKCHCKILVIFCVCLDEVSLDPFWRLLMYGLVSAMLPSWKSKKKRLMCGGKGFSARKCQLGSFFSLSGSMNGNGFNSWSIISELDYSLLCLPSQVALVQWTESVGLTLVGRDQSSMQLRTPGGHILNFTILQIFPFTYESKRMGIIVRVGGSATLFCLCGCPANAAWEAQCFCSWSSVAPQATGWFCGWSQQHLSAG